MAKPMLTESPALIVTGFLRYKSVVDSCMETIPAATEVYVGCTFIANLERIKKSVFYRWIVLRNSKHFRSIPAQYLQVPTGIFHNF